MSSKSRKPRATNERVSHAIEFVEIAKMCISIVKNINSDDPVSSCVKDKQKILSNGGEYLTDLLEWELDKIGKK